MKILHAFFILIVGAVALPSRRDVDEQTRRVKESLPFMAIVHAADEYIDVQEWAIILTDRWILSSFNTSPLKTFDITVEVYTDLFATKRYQYEIDTIKELKSKNADLYPPFNLIKLKSSIIFGDSRKPIPLAGPNYEWDEVEDATAYYLISKFPEEFSGLHEYFNPLPVEVITDENFYESEVSSCLKSQRPEVLNLLECDPTISNGTLIGFNVRLECENRPFLKISSIYDWILNNVPELQYQNSVNENSIILPKIESDWKAFLSQRLFGTQQPNFLNLMNFKNVSINVKLIQDNQ